MEDDPANEHTVKRYWKNRCKIFLQRQLLIDKGIAGESNLNRLCLLRFFGDAGAPAAGA